ncbi:hypothetical protein [Membranihabitans marinus]|uniref:hypothetical protein n=1 Tax=Membranihabitans marinus TaxID=1227546 RepID=UPI0021BD2251|nr:hypothetical protein [Membranihabitans marinus]
MMQKFENWTDTYTYTDYLEILTKPQTAIVKRSNGTGTRNLVLHYFVWLRIEEISGHAVDFIGSFMDALGMGKAAYIGHSMGGGIK